MYELSSWSAIKLLNLIYYSFVCLLSVSWIHFILMWIRILGSTFGYSGSGSGSSDSIFGNRGSGSSDPHLEIVDPDPGFRVDSDPDPDPDPGTYFSIIIFFSLPWNKQLTLYNIMIYTNAHMYFTWVRQFYQ